MGKNEKDRQVKKFGKDFDTCLSRNEENGCLEWTGHLDRDGYGERGSRYGERKAHRYAYARAFNEIPTGLIVRHKCDNPKCCEPEHLELGTHQDNRTDTVRRKRHAFGEKNNHAIVTEDDVRMIRKLYEAGQTQTGISKQYGITQGAVHLIVKRKNWKHVV